VCVCHHSSKLVLASRVARSQEKGFVARRSRSVVARAGVAEMPKEVREQINLNVQVSEVGNEIAMLTGLHPDVKLGTFVHFGGGARGILLWRREPLTFCAILDDAKVEKGEKVTCDPEQRAGVAVNETAWGSVVGPNVGLEVCGKKPDITQVVLLVNDPPDVPSRFPINSNMHTGFTAVDAFTPIGRGQSMMIESIHPEARTKFGVNTVLAQKQTGVKCVYAVTGRAGTQSSNVVNALLRLRAEQNIKNAPCIVTTKQGASACERYLAACVACSMAESVRDTGGDALVVLDDLSCLNDFWDAISVMWHGFMDNEWKQQSLALDQEDAKDAEDAEDAKVAAEAKAPEAEGGEAQQNEKATKQKSKPGSAEEMVEFGGNLVPIEVAERRSYFSAFLQRAARMNKKYDDGTLTILGIVAGRPANAMHGGSGAEGVSYGKSPEEVVAQYTTLNEAQKEKLLAALKAKQAADQNHEVAAQMWGEVDPNPLPTGIVEEFNSISDGHINLQMPTKGKVAINLRSSVSRIGTPAAAPVMRQLKTAEVRLQVMQSVDEQEYSTQAASALGQKWLSLSKNMMALCEDTCEKPKPLAEQVVALYALLKADATHERMETLLARMRSEHNSVLEEIETSVTLSPELVAQLDKIVKAV